MNVLITGSRSIHKYEYVKAILDTKIQKDDVLIQGGADGVDKLAQVWCADSHVEVKTIKPVDHRRESYLQRNAEMIGMCDKVIAIWDGASRGTKFTIDYAKNRGKKIKIYDLTQLRRHLNIDQEELI